MDWFFVIFWILLKELIFICFFFLFNKVFFFFRIGGDFLDFLDLFNFFKVLLNVL